VRGAGFRHCRGILFCECRGICATSFLLNTSSSSYEGFGTNLLSGGLHTYRFTNVSLATTRVRTKTTGVIFFLPVSTQGYVAGILFEAVVVRGGGGGKSSHDTYASVFSYSSSEDTRHARSVLSELLSLILSDFVDPTTIISSPILHGPLV
jgi:hypothetical protein